MGFDFLAPHYRWMERVLAGGKLQRCRTAWLPAVTGCQSVLLLGEGNGRFLGECVRALPNAVFTCVDASGAMLGLARERWLRRGGLDSRVTFIQADVLDWVPESSCYDLVVTNFFLDCFRSEQLELLARRLAGATVQGAKWLLSDFCEPAGGWQRLRARWILSSMYAFFRATTALPARRLTPPDLALRKAGFALSQRRYFEWGLLHSDLWER
jgi:SAM-dependent methyltransferase